MQCCVCAKLFKEAKPFSITLSRKIHSWSIVSERARTETEQ